jgi:hypothetical protein
MLFLSNPVLGRENRGEVRRKIRCGDVTDGWEQLDLLCVGMS